MGASSAATIQLDTLGKGMSGIVQLSIKIHSVYILWLVVSGSGDFAGSAYITHDMHIIQLFCLCVCALGMWSIHRAVNMNHDDDVGSYVQQTEHDKGIHIRDKILSLWEKIKFAAWDVPFDLLQLYSTNASYDAYAVSSYVLLPALLSQLSLSIVRSRPLWSRPKNQSTDFLPWVLILGFHMVHVLWLLGGVVRFATSEKFSTRLQGIYPCYIFVFVLFLMASTSPGVDLSDHIYLEHVSNTTSLETSLVNTEYVGQVGMVVLVLASVFLVWAAFIVDVLVTFAGSWKWVKRAASGAMWSIFIIYLFGLFHEHVEDTVAVIFLDFRFVFSYLSGVALASIIAARCRIEDMLEGRPVVDHRLFTSVDLTV